MAERKTRTFDGADSSTRIRCTDLTDLKQTPFILFGSWGLVAAGMGIVFLPKMVAEQASPRLA
jgi:hypothetical protein